MKKIISIISLLIVFAVSLTSGTVGASSDEYAIINDVNNPKTVDQIKYEISVFDLEDSLSRDDIYVILDNYTGNESILGEFIVIYGVRDSHNYEVTIAITVKNVDVRSPEILYTEESLRISQGTDLENYNFDFTAVDGFEGNVTASIEVIGKDSIDTSVLGSYDITVRAFDSSGNKVELVLTANVVDSTNPVINCPETIIKRYDYILSSTFFLEYITANDDTDGNITTFVTVLSNGYLGNGNIPGTYEVILSVEDSAGNKTTKSIMVTVDKTLDALMVIDYQDLYLDVNQNLDTADFIQLMKQIGELPDNDFIIEDVNDTYKTHVDVKGTYVKQFNLTAANGTDYEMRLNVNVINANLDVIEDNPTFIEDSMDFFKGFWIVLAVIVVFVLGLLKSRSKKPNKFRKY